MPSEQPTYQNCAIALLCRGKLAMPRARESQGDGWGGPAKGASGKPAKPFTANSPTRVTHPTLDGTMPPMSDRKALKRQRTELLEDMLFRLAESAEREETQVSAAVKLHAIWNGQPVAKNINVNTDDITNLSDDELRAELESAGRAAGSAAEGTEA